MSNGPAMETARLRLRPFAPEDLDALHALWTQPRVREFLWDDEVISRELAASVIEASRASFAAHGFGFWVLMPKGEDRVIGFCGLRHFGEPPAVEVMYGLEPGWWGQGLATEAALAMLRFGFEQCGLGEIYAGADPPNASSFRVMERCGMRFARREVIGGKEALYYVITAPGR